MKTPFSHTRRDFLRRSACATLGAVSAGAMLSQLGLMRAALAADAACPAPGAEDYRALVCVFLFGGNDSFNLLVPTDATRYAQYAAARGAMGLPQDQFLALNALGSGNGEQYGVHPRCKAMKTLFNAGHAAFVVNTGTLIKPTTKTDYLGGNFPLPPQLFSHNDQQALWQYGRPEANGTVGWGGLAADRLYVLNSGATIPMSISLGGQNRYQAGLSIQPYSLGAAGPTGLQGYVPGKPQMDALQELLHQAQPDPLSRTYQRTLGESIDYYDAMSAALAGAPPLATPFPADNALGDALKMIAQIVSVRGALAAKRQIFFVSLGGFDTHDDQLALQPDLLGTVSDALGAFYAATEELQIQNAVTTFTMSEFSRTLNTDGDGTDHAWAGHQFVMGGAVKGQRLYGTPAVSGGLYPSLILDGQDCLARGQMIPATSCDQYAATLARWIGLADCDLDAVFPYLSGFPVRDLGFLA